MRKKTLDHELLREYFPVLPPSFDIRIPNHKQAESLTEENQRHPQQNQRKVQNFIR